jgi:hypothetical protein
MTTDGGNSEPTSNQYRSTGRAVGTGNLSRGVTPPPQGSTSSFGGGTGGSVDHVGDGGGGGSGGSVSGSWGNHRGGGGGGGRRSGSRPENRFDEDEFLPFAMERSDFNTVGKPDDPGVGGR